MPGLLTAAAGLLGGSTLKWIGLAAAGAAIAGAVWWVMDLRADLAEAEGDLVAAGRTIEQLRSDLDTAEGVNTMLAAELDRQAAREAFAREQLAAEHDAALERAERHTIIRERIIHAPPGDDGPMAPVLRGVVDSLPWADRTAGAANPEGAGLPQAGYPSGGAPLPEPSGAAGR